MKNGLILQPERWAPSQHPYALLRSSAKRDRIGTRYSTWRIDSIWVGKKRGNLVVTVGQLSLSNFRDEYDSLEDAIANADMRYGGRWLANWDGTQFNVNPERIVRFQDYTQYISILDPILESLPTVPESYEGWYYRKSTLR